MNEDMGSVASLPRHENGGCEPADADDGLDMLLALARLRRELPGWWWTAGRCGLTCHASIGPDRAFIAEPILSKYDDGFHADLPNPSSVAQALDDCITQALAAGGELPSPFTLVEPGPGKIFGARWGPRMAGTYPVPTYRPLKSEVP